MTTDIREVCERALASRPVMPPAATILAQARAADRRRRQIAAGGAGVAAVVVTAVSLALLMYLAPAADNRREQTAGRPAPAVPTAGGPESPAVPVGPPAPPVPSDVPTPRYDGSVARTPRNHATNMQRVLVRMLPSGWKLGGRNDPAPLPATPVTPAELRAGTSTQDGDVLVTAIVATAFYGNRRGTLVAYLVWDGRPAPADPCARAVPAVGKPVSCTVRDSRGTPVRLAEHAHPAGPARSAVVFLDDGYLVVAEFSGVLMPDQTVLPPDADPRALAAAPSTGPPQPPATRLTELPFTAAQLATVATDSTMLPG